MACLSLNLPARAPTAPRQSDRSQPSDCPLVKARAVIMMRRMKTLAVLFLSVFFLGLGGCAFTESSVEDVGGQFQEGLQGRGRLVPDNPTSDSFGPLYR